MWPGTGPAGSAHPVHARGPSRAHSATPTLTRVDLLLALAFAVGLFSIPGLVWWWWDRREARKRHVREWLANYERTHGYPFNERTGREPRE